MALRSEPSQAISTMRLSAICNLSLFTQAPTAALRVVTSKHARRCHSRDRDPIFAYANRCDAGEVFRRIELSIVLAIGTTPATASLCKR